MWSGLDGKFEVSYPADLQLHIGTFLSAHRNDMENILPFFTIGFLYMFVQPNVLAAIWLYRIAAIVRIVHTIVYAVWVVPQPARAIAFFTCLSITLYMAIHCMVEFGKYI
jgi:glutathione S-transferase